MCGSKWLKQKKTCFYAKYKPFQNAHPKICPITQVHIQEMFWKITTNT